MAASAAMTRRGEILVPIAIGTRNYAARAFRIAGDGGGLLAAAFTCCALAMGTYLDKTAGNETISNYEVRDQSGTLFRYRGSSYLSETHVIERLRQGPTEVNSNPRLPIISFKQLDPKVEREIAFDHLMAAVLVSVIGLSWWLIMRGAVRLLRA